MFPAHNSKIIPPHGLLAIPPRVHSIAITQRIIRPLSAIVRFLLHFRSSKSSTMFRMYGRQQIDEKGENVKREDKRDGPFEDARSVVPVLEIADSEGDGEHDFEEDEGELYPEGGAEDAVLAEMNSQTLILPADKNRRDNISRDEE